MFAAVSTAFSCVPCNIVSPHAHCSPWALDNTTLITRRESTAEAESEGGGMVKWWG